MDSEESRPGSSASNSSSNSSDNSRPSSPTPTNDDDGPKSPTPANSAPASPQSSEGGRRSRLRSRSSNEGGARSGSKSDSDSSSSSSSTTTNDNNENDDDAKSAVSAGQNKSRPSTERSSSAGSAADKHQRSASRNRSVSPDKSRQSSRNSSSSSNRSRSNSREIERGADAGINISHEDLSDVSDMESEKRASSFHNNSKQSLEDEGTNVSLASVPAAPDDDVDAATTAQANKRRFSTEADNSQNAVITDLRQKLDQKKNQQKASEGAKDKSGDNTPNGNGHVGEPLEDLVKTHDEDALDFEAEEGECQDVSKEEEEEQRLLEKSAESEKRKGEDKSDGEAEEGEELEEGEVSDEDEKRPEETEPKPVCRFYTRGQCTWGMSCRFLHPGVTDKGNYTMFDLVRPVPVTQNAAGVARVPAYAAHAADYHDYRTERPSYHQRAPVHHPTTSTYPAHHEPRTLIPDGPVVVESAWERGLRTAKEMMRKANKRKEQDMDFEDKKMNLTLSPDELEKDPYYLKERASPPEPAIPPYGRHAPPIYEEAPPSIYSPPDRFGRGGPPVPPPYDEIDPYGRSTRYRELPPHRMPQYEDERRVRPTREVIVQRVEPVGRGDEWNDPWMRSKSPGARGGSRERADKRRRDRRSYSSNSSYSSSSSSQSDSSSDSSRSPSPADHRRRYNSATHKSPPPAAHARRHGARPAARSPSQPVRRNRRSPTGNRHSPVPKRRGVHISPTPAVDKRSGAYSPTHKRKKLSPTSKKTLSEKTKALAKRRHTSSSSATGSSDSSASESDSESGSSSSDTSSRSKGRTPPKRARGTDKLSNDKKLVKKAEPPKKRSPISIEIKKQNVVGTSALATSPTHSVSSEKDTKKSRREELLKQLRAVEDAIAKKRSKLA